MTIQAKISELVDAHFHLLKCYVELLQDTFLKVNITNNCLEIEVVKWLLDYIKFTHSLIVGILILHITHHFYITEAENEANSIKTLSNALSKSSLNV